MPKHISKMEDGHFLVETDEEYKKRTGGGCLGTLGVLLILAFIVFAKCDDDDKSTDATPKTEVAAQKPETKTETISKPAEAPKAATSNATPVVSKSVEEDIPVAKDEPKESKVQTNSPITKEIVEDATASVDIEAAVKQVNKLYRTATAALKEGNNDEALKPLEDMKAIQAEMPKKVNRINDKIKSLERKIK